MLPVESNTEDRSIACPDSPIAWRMAIAAFFSGLVIFGVVYSFGVFLQPIAVDFGSSRTAVGAYYAISSFIWYVLGPFTGRLSDSIGSRPLMACGALCMGLGLIATAAIGNVWTGYFTYGLGVGLAAAFSYVPALAILGRWFVKKRNTAFGSAAAGTGVGMLVVPPACAALIEDFGWRMTMVVFGVVAAAILGLCAAFQRHPPKATHAKNSNEALRPMLASRPFILLYVSWVLATSALFVPFLYLPGFASSHGASFVAASSLLSILGGVSVIGRLGVGLLGTRMSNLHLFKMSVLAMAASYMIWLAIPKYWGLVIFAICLDIPYGIRIALVPPVLIECFGTGNLGSILGAFFTATGLAALIGPMLAGFVMDLTGSYEWGIGLAFALGALGYVVILLLKPEQYGARAAEVAA